MLSLEPFAEMLTLYRENAERFRKVADGVGIPTFSPSLRAELLHLLGDGEAVQVIETASRIKGLFDLDSIQSEDRTVAVILDREGIKRRPGKRAHRGLTVAVETLAPLLLALGVPRRTSERSKLVKVLRAITLELGFPGDPRDMLRSAMRTSKAMQKAAQAMPDGYHVFLEAFARGIAPDSD